MLKITQPYVVALGYKLVRKLLWEENTHLRLNSASPTHIILSIWKCMHMPLLI